MMKERTEQMSKRAPTSSSSSSFSSDKNKNDEEVKSRLQEMEANFRILETVKGLDARIMEVEVKK